MFRDLVSSRLIQAGLVFFVIVVGGSLLYYWHVHRTTINELGPIPVAVESMENGSPQTNTAPAGFHNDGVTKSNETTDTQKSETSEALPNETETLDIADAFLPEDFVSAEDAPAEDVPVSPFGFGPYPEVPEGYPNPNLWDYAETLYAFSPERARDWELRERVRIALWKQGKRSESITMENGLVYPCYPNTIYVRWGEIRDENGKPVAYIEELLAPASLSHHEADFDNDTIPPGITVIPYDEGGIEPYTFLNLN